MPARIPAGWCITVIGVLRILSIRYNERLADSIIGHYNTEVIRRRGPWRPIEAVGLATLDGVDWFNNRRLLEAIGNVPPAEFEQTYYRSQENHATVARLTHGGSPLISARIEQSGEVFQ